jgi:peptidoglycan endopeptidase LytE
VPSFFVFTAVLAVLAFDVQGQDRQRIARPVLSQPLNQPAPIADKTKTTLSSQPTNLPARQPLTNDIRVSEDYSRQLVKKTADSRPVSAMIPAAARISRYSSLTTAAMANSIQSKLGIPYLYGSTGPNRYDCSGFVWAVFSEAGMGFTRQSAAGLWNASTPVEGDDRYRFGTLVFFNGLGHIGIVADANGFYHASTSKGVTYSTFTGYWEKRIVGFRKFNPHTVEPDIQEAK